MQFVINKKDNNLNITFTNCNDIYDVQKFLTYMLPCYLDIKTKINSFNDENFQNYVENYENQRKNEIKQIENCFNEEIVLKNQEIKQLQQKIVLIENDFEERQEKLKNQTSKLYEIETELRMDLLKTQLTNKNSLLESEKNKEIELLKQKLEHINTIDKYLEFNFNKSLDLHNQIKDHFEEKHISTKERGVIGEQFILGELQKIICFDSDAFIDNVAGKSESGDIYFKLKELKCCIEVKNHTDVIRQKEIFKFERDIMDVRYNCGLFISLNSEIVQVSNINNFEIKIIDNKPCIYLVNFHQHPENLYIAIKTLLFLLQNKTMITNDTQEYIEKLNKTINNLNKLQEQCNIIEKSVKNSKSIIKEELEEIHNLINVEENNELQCNLCLKTYKTKKTLEKHKKDKHCTALSTDNKGQ